MGIVNPHTASYPENVGSRIRTLGGGVRGAADFDARTQAIVARVNVRKSAINACGRESLWSRENLSVWCIAMLLTLLAIRPLGRRWRAREPGSMLRRRW